MNAITKFNTLNLLNGQQLDSELICPKHQTPMSIVAGHDFCKQCSFELLEQSKKQHAADVEKMVREKHFAGAMLPKRHAQSGFTQFVVSNSGQQEAKVGCYNYVKNFIAGDKQNLIMVGRTGTGKTHLAAAVARNALNKGKRARYVTSEDMANKIANAWTQFDDTEANAIHKFTEYDLLILDEYGLHDRHEKRLELVHKVLYARYDANKPTMIISNLTLDDLRKDLGDRLWSRLQHDGLTLIECNWADQRVGGEV